MGSIRSSNLTAAVVCLLMLGAMWCRNLGLAAEVPGEPGKAFALGENAVPLWERRLPETDGVASIALAGPYLWVLGRWGGPLYCLDRESGNILWSTEPFLSASPLLAMPDGVVAFTSDGVLMKWSLAGRRLWTVHLTHFTDDINSVAAHQLILSEGEIFLAPHLILNSPPRKQDQYSYIYVVDGTTGRLKRRFFQYEQFDSSKILAVDPTTVFVGDWSEYKKTVALDRFTGRVRRDYGVTGAFDGVLQGRLIAARGGYDVETGQRVWPRGKEDPPLCVSNGRLFRVSHYPKDLQRLDPLSGSPLWSLASVGPLAEMRRRPWWEWDWTFDNIPVVTNDQVVAIPCSRKDQAHYLCLLHAETGTLLALCPVAEAARAMAVENGRVYVGCWDRVQAVGVPPLME